VRRTLTLLAALAGALVVGSAPSSSRAGASVPCDLRLRFGSHSEQPVGQFRVSLVFVNGRYEAPCRVSGFPDVELIGPVYRTHGSIYGLPDQVGRSRSAVLQPGQSAHAVLTWLRPSRRADRWVPGYIRAVVPTNRGPSLPMALPWHFGAVLRQDAATHPGTYVGPLRPGTG